jgi:copper(I)-binding protein
MSIKTVLMAAAAAASLVMPAFAGDIVIEGAYARASGKSAKSGAAFMMIKNTGTENDRLIKATSSASKRLETHTHIMTDDGIMQMREVEEGFEIPAKGMHMLQRGGDHLMFMGLNGPMNDGDVLSVTMTFEKAGEITVKIPVDLKRKPAKMMHKKMKKASE